MRSINTPDRIHRTGLEVFGEKYSGAVFRHTEWVVPAGETVSISSVF